MKPTSLLVRLQRSVAACLTALLLATAAVAASPYTMTTRDGFVCVVDSNTGDVFYRSDIPAALLSQRDRLLLEAGIALETQADFTSALEDFCS